MDDQPVQRDLRWQHQHRRDCPGGWFEPLRLWLDRDGAWQHRCVGEDRLHLCRLEHPANGLGTAYSPADTFTLGAANVTLYAQWTINTYTVSFDAQGGTPTPGNQTVAYGGLVTDPGAPTRTGYTFSGWYTAPTGGSLWTFATDTMGAADMTLYARWTVNNYTVSFDAQGGTPTPGNQTVAYGGLVTDPGAPTRTGYTFSGWYTAPTGGSLWTFATDTMGAADMTLYARWTANNYTVSFDAQGGSPTPGNQTVAYGGLVTDPGAPTRTGYTFSGWYTAPTGGSLWTFATDTMGAADMTLYAQWTIIGMYTVTYAGNGNTGGTAPVDGSSPYIFGSTVTVLGNTGALVKTGYTFAGWNTASDGSGTAYAPAATFVIGAADVILYARWTVNTYTVSFDAQGGTPTPGNQTVAYGGLVTDPGAPTRTGYTFGGWYTAPTGGSLWTFATDTMGAADMTLYARWTVNTYTVSFDAQGGSPTPGNQTVAYGGLVTLPSDPTYTGHTFNGWYTAPAGGSLWTFATDTMGAADMTLYAQWTINSYTVTYAGNGNTGGTAPVDGSSPYTFGSTVTVLGNTGALVKAGYTFAGWNTAADGSGTAYAPAATFVIGAANVTLYAQWTALPNHTVTFNANGGTGSMGNQVANVPTALTANAFTRTGYSFSGWNTAANGSGTNYADGAIYSFAADITLYAQWSALPNHAVTFNANGGTGTMSNQVTNVPTALTLNTFTRTGYSFNGWNTAVNGTGTAYANGAIYPFAADATLYAQWTALAGHTVTFNSNGGTGTMSPQTANVPTALTLNTFTRTRYSFSGWNTAANGTGTAYANGAAYSFAADITLYAQWRVYIYLPLILR